MRTIGILALCAFLLSASVHHHLHVTYRTGGMMFSQLLYLPSGKYLKPVALGYDNLIADFLYLWSIQYYSDPGFHPRMEYLRHTYDIITELDPRFIDAYQTGALFLSYEGRNTQAALQFLDKGFQKNPTEWILPTDAGFYCYINMRNYRLAERYFEQALKVPGSPQSLKRLLAGIHLRMGEKERAYLLWKEIYETASTPSRKRIAAQHIYELGITIDLDRLSKAVNDYHRTYGTNPVNLGRLSAVGLLTSVPADPQGNPYDYDPRTGKVSYSKGLILYKRLRR